MESPLQCEKLLKNLQKIDENHSKVIQSVQCLNINESMKALDEKEIGEKAINFIHLPYKHIAMKSGKNIRSKLWKVSIGFRT